ncbi:MAG: phytoene desaturase family protein, partial [Longimicrobiales bacterium]
VLRDGSEIAASRVVSSAEPRHTLLTLADPLQLDPDFVRAVRHIRFRGVTARVHLALGELPRFRGMNGDAALGSTISIAPHLDYVEQAYDDAKHGGVSGQLCLEANIPSLLDPGVSPAGRHAMSISVQYAPYRLNGAGWNAAAREALADAAIATLAEYAPELPGAILDRRVLSPADIEEHYGAPEGSLEHGEITLDQILFMRPVPGWAHYRTPVHGLFLCGAGTHPGGRVAGGGGRLAAAAMARDKVNASA